jgi:hypothetical protein
MSEVSLSTAAEARAIILLAIENAGRDEILGKIVEWNNTTDNDIDTDGDVWVANPQAGHWLNDDRLIEFAVYIAAAAVSAAADRMFGVAL